VTRNAYFWAGLLIVLFGFSGLGNTQPLLGKIKNGRYTHAENLFSCPLPGPSLGFRGPVRIEDAARIVKKRRVFRPNHPRALFEGPFVEETIYPVRYKPSIKIRFSDKTNKGTRIEILYRPLRKGETREPLYRYGFQGGNYGPLHEEVRTAGGRKYGFALAQLPYFARERNYMGMNLWAMHLRSNKPPPTLDTLINLIRGGYHFSILMQSSSLPFLPRQINWRDLEAVYKALKANSSLIDKMRRRALEWVGQCRFSGDGRRK